MNTAQNMAFKPKSKDNLKDQKNIQQGSKRILQKTYSQKIWILQNIEKINAQICKNGTTNGQQMFGKEKITEGSRDGERY
jgi:hypothetical protein